MSWLSQALRRNTSALAILAPWASSALIANPQTRAVLAKDVVNAVNHWQAEVRRMQIARLAFIGALLNPTVTAAPILASKQAKRQVQVDAQKTVNVVQDKVLRPLAEATKKFWLLMPITTVWSAKHRDQAAHDVQVGAQKVAKGIGKAVGELFKFAGRMISAAFGPVGLAILLIIGIVWLTRE